MTAFHKVDLGHLNLDPNRLAAAGLKVKRVGDHNALYCTDQASGAIPNGTRIVKRNSKYGDANRDGDGGTVIGSIFDAEIAARFNEQFGYFVEWDRTPVVPAFIVGSRIRPA